MYQPLLGCIQPVSCTTGMRISRQSLRHRTEPACPVVQLRLAHPQLYSQTVTHNQQCSVMCMCAFADRA
jgi:hypothetical protein